MTADFSSLVVLRAKEGEFDALHAWDRAEQIQHVQPLLDLEPTSPPPQKQLNEVEETARKLHEHGRHLMIDASRVAHSHNFGGGPAGAFGELADRLEFPMSLFDTHPVPFEPVIRNDAGGEELSVYNNLCEELGIGGAVRVRLTESGGERIDRFLERIHLDNADLDIILDLQYVAEGAPELGDRAAAALQAIAAAGPFRSTTVLSGSVPRSLGRTSTWEQPRVEEELWSLLREENSDLRLGDYGVVHPRPSDGGRSKHVSLKYSCGGRWRYSREPVQEVADDDTEESARASTLRAICCELVESEHFCGRTFSWGDAEISTASNARGPKWGRTSRSVALATSHHLAYLAARACTEKPRSAAGEH